MQPAAEADVDLSEIFSMDKIAYNARNINYWCVLAVRLSTHTHHTDTQTQDDHC